jgi:ribonuclease HII
VNANKYIVDGKLNLGKFRDKNKNVISIIRADTYIDSVIAAGIVAKVTRDRIMYNLSKIHSKYLWQKNAGYGTYDHIQAIMKYGQVRFHRQIFINTALKNFRRKTSFTDLVNGIE